MFALHNNTTPYCYHYEGYWKNKKFKKWQQNSLKNISLNNAVRKLQL